MSAQNKIALSDYDYEKDIEIRLFLRDFTSDEIAVFQQIQLSSLHFSIDQIPKNKQHTLEKFEKMDLLHVIENKVFVNKELRKHVEIDAAKLENDFTPNFTYLQHLLARLPQHILPVWYPLPKSSNNIFKTLIEQYFLTPHLYQKYLEKLNFEEDVLSQIVSFVHKKHQVTLSELEQTFQLSPKKLHESILFLEYHFALILSYRIEKGAVEEIVTPPIEWVKWNQYLQKSHPSTFSESSVNRIYKEDFGALLHINQGLKGEISTNTHPQFLNYVTFLKLTNQQNIDQWLSMPLKDQAIALYRHLTKKSTDHSIWQVEKALKKVISLGWISLDAFLNSLTISIGDAEQATLKLGKNSRYQLPNYTKKEYDLVVKILKNHFFHTGFVAFGTFNGKECFKVTDFGRQAIE